MSRDGAPVKNGSPANIWELDEAVSKAGADHGEASLLIAKLLVGTAAGRSMCRVRRHPRAGTEVVNIGSGEGDRCAALVAYG